MKVSERDIKIQLNILQKKIYELYGYNKISMLACKVLELDPNHSFKDFGLFYYDLDSVFDLIDEMDSIQAILDFIRLNSKEFLDEGLKTLNLKTK